jgi:hypothetical protein
MLQEAAMKTRVAILLTAVILGGSMFWAQTHSDGKPESAPPPAACGLNHADMQDELQELNTYTSRMQSRIVMIRNGAGTVQNPQVRDALQVDGEMWQDEVDHLKRRISRLQAAMDRCEKK